LKNNKNIIQLVLLRHGQSVWNRDKVFTGWSDVELSPKGRQEAEQAGQMLKDAGFYFDLCFTSMLKRAIQTQQIATQTMGLNDLPIQRDWRLNERHYGALEGIPHWDAIVQFGLWPILMSQVKFTVPPPTLDATDPRFPGNQDRYSAINPGELPLTESMEHTHARIQPYWQETIVPEIQAGKRILIVSHNNILRTLMMHLDNLSQTQVMKLSLATAKPVVYELDSELKAIQHYNL